MVAVRSLSLIGCKNLNSDLVANIPHLFPNLEELQLTGSRVSDDDILWIVDCKKLRELRVDETNVTGRGVEILLADRSWERIEYPGKGTLREVNKKTIDSNDNSDIP
jgi:hypothetical protein